ncbi:MAG: LemA family protein [Candidatus Micrarchaeaceae archaeon]
MIGFILAAVVAVIIIAVVVLYNGFVTKKNRVQTAWAQIDVQLKRRYDLIPNLVNTVKGYKNYEKDVLTKVTQLRTSIISGSVQDKATANNQLSQALKSIFAVAENYPDLKASDNFKMLQQQLADTEDKIAFVRTSYNDYVLDYNNAIMEFPGNIFAPIFHFSKQDFFQAPSDAERAPVNVNFDDSGVRAGQGAAQKQAGKTDRK